MLLKTGHQTITLVPTTPTVFALPKKVEHTK